jgi:hypothetical protein
MGVNPLFTLAQGLFKKAIIGLDAVKNLRRCSVCDNFDWFFFLLEVKL